MRRLYLLIMGFSFLSSAYAADELLPAPKQGEWRANVKEEEQTLAAFVATKPYHATSESIVYVMPVGRFTKEQRRLIGKTADALAQRLGLTVRIMPDVVLAKIDESGVRTNPMTGKFQLDAAHVIETFVETQAPSGYASVVAVTAHDIWPGNATNYVLGLATPQTRVALVSVARMWEGGVDDVQALERFKKLVAHECLHTFGLAHETKFRSLMNGYNSISELDALIDTCAAPSKEKAKVVGISC